MHIYNDKETAQTLNKLLTQTDTEASGPSNKTNEKRYNQQVARTNTNDSSNKTSQHLNNKAKWRHEAP